MLSRLLSVAAAATAATLMGDDHQALSEARSLTGSTGLGDVGGNGEDGSFDGFLRALQNGRIASALRQGGGEAAEQDSGEQNQAGALNFFRMFRFGASGMLTPTKSKETIIRYGNALHGLGAWREAMYLPPVECKKVETVASHVLWKHQGFS